MPRKILFVCNQNRLRSPTAEAIFSTHEGLEVKSAGVDKDATICINRDLLEWADLIFVMEKRQRNKIREKYEDIYRQKKIICLYIPDQYDFMDPSLVSLLKERMAPYLM